MTNLQAVETEFVVIGGGGEPKGKTTIFDEGIKLLGSMATRNKFKEMKISFNGGHEETEKQLQTSFPTTTTTPFTASSYESIINDYIKKIETKPIQSGGQILIYINSHGAVQGKSEISHSIAVTSKRLNSEPIDLKTLKHVEIVSLDQLKDLKKIAKAKNVKLAIIDDSCFSGNSISLADESTCVIASTGPNNFSYGGPNSFSNLLLEKMSPGKTLEDAFIEARENSIDYNLPQISTKENAYIKDFIYKSLHQYYYFHSIHDQTFDKYLATQLNEENICQHNLDSQKLLTKFDELQKILSITKSRFWGTWAEKIVDLDPLKAALQNYKANFDELIENELLLNKDEYKKIHTFINIPGEPDIKLSSRELFTMNTDSAFKKLQEKLNEEESETEKEKIHKEILTLTLIINEKIRLTPEHKALVNLVSKNQELRKKTMEHTSSISANEKKLYHALYKKLKTEAPSDNPCSDFKL